MAFDVYFPISEVASRLGVSTLTVRRWAERGELGPVWKPARELTVGQVGLLAFLERRRVDLTDVGAKELRRQAMDRRLGRPAPVERGDLSPGVAARSEGELRRKLSRCLDREETHHV